MDKILELLSKINHPIAKIITIVLICAIIGISLFFQGCATTTQFDKLQIDNFTHKTEFKGK